MFEYAIAAILFGLLLVVSEFQSSKGILGRHSKLQPPKGIREFFFWRAASGWIGRGEGAPMQKRIIITARNLQVAVKTTKESCSSEQMLANVKARVESCYLAPDALGLCCLDSLPVRPGRCLLCVLLARRRACVWPDLATCSRSTFVPCSGPRRVYLALSRLAVRPGMGQQLGATTMTEQLPSSMM